SDELDRFLGVDVERLYTLVGTANPPGVCISANESGGALHLGLTREAGAVPTGRAERFLDALTADLVA
ncbi:MAG TPA: hypothetical protein VM778_04645, partial [Gemmatimonadota bacterium]|nr:hypothetical protein [Gemmatimonadota bacterium]